MDPNATLQEMLELAHTLIADDPDKMDAEAAFGAVYNGQRLAELVEALHGWLSKGGFLPTEWRR